MRLCELISRCTNCTDDGPRIDPLYFVTVGSEHGERLVYVGKTSAAVGRFRTGHAALTKLLDPVYDGVVKHVYFASVMLLAAGRSRADGSAYLPLEWVRPLGTAEEILASVENALIFNFQPELNTNLREAYRPTRDVSLHLQNFCTESEFLNDKMVSPVAARPRSAR